MIFETSEFVKDNENNPPNTGLHSNRKSHRSLRQMEKVQERRAHVEKKTKTLCTLGLGTAENEVVTRVGMDGGGRRPTLAATLREGC